MSPKAPKRKTTMRMGPTMTDVETFDTTEQSSPPRIPESVRQRSTNRAASSPASGGGPAPGRIVAAAGSISLGIGLVAVLAGTGRSDVVVEVNPTPVIVQPAPIVTEVTESGFSQSSTAPQDMIVIAGAVPVDSPVDGAPVARSEGS